MKVLALEKERDQLNHTTEELQRRSQFNTLNPNHQHNESQQIQEYQQQIHNLKEQLHQQTSGIYEKIKSFENQNEKQTELTRSIVIERQ